MKQAADFHSLNSYLLLFQSNEEDNPLPINVSSLNEIQPAKGIELFIFGLMDLIDRDVERNSAIPKYAKIMRALQADIKGIVGKANKKLDALREESSNAA